MSFASLDAIVSRCAQHLDDTHSRSTEIELYLVEYLVMVISGEFESIIRAVVIKRADRAADQQLTAFIKSATSNLFRSLKCSEIAGLLNRFDPLLKDAFSSTVNNTKAQASLDSIVANRHSIAHGTGRVNLTFRELLEFYEDSKVVLHTFATHLGVTI